MKQLSLFCFFILCGLSFGQTKMIFHKSHSGTSSNFLTTIKHNPSNFGMAPTRMVRNSKLDSVILIDDNIAIMVTSEECKEYDYGSDRHFSNSLWSAGKDTVYNHPLFNKEKSIIEIQRTLKEEYFFANDISSVKFVGFDKKSKGSHDLYEPDFELDERELLIRQSLQEQQTANQKNTTKGKKKKIDPFLKWFLFGWLTIFFNDSY